MTHRDEAAVWLLSVAYTDLLSDSRVLREAREAALRGARVSILAPEQQASANAIQALPFDIEWLPTTREGGHATVTGYARFIRAVRTWMRRQATVPDVVHIHNMPDYLYWLFRPWQRAGARIVLDVHDIMSDLAVHKFKGPLRHVGKWILKKTEESVWRRVDQIITVHEPYRRRLNERGIPQERIAVVLNVPEPVQCRAELRRPPPDTQFKIVFHGTITTRTGILHAVRAMPLVLEAIPDAQLHIVGDGDKRDMVIEEVATLHLGNRVELSDGFLPLSQVIDRVCDAHVAVVPNERSSYTEAILPVKFLEYATLGIPAIATRLPVLEEYFGDHAAYFIPDPRPELIAQGIITFASDENFRLAVGRRAQARANSHRWARYADSLAAALGISF